VSQLINVVVVISELRLCLTYFSLLCRQCAGAFSSNNRMGRFAKIMLWHSDCAAFDRQDSFTPRSPNEFHNRRTNPKIKFMRKSKVFLPLQFTSSLLGLLGVISEINLKTV